MSDKIKCGEGKDCLRCKFYDRLQKIGALANFTRNKMGRCDWFSDKTDPSKDVIKIVH